MQYSIKMVARKTGLTPHVIRVWEKRYGVVTPDRSDTNRRLYSEEEVHRLALLGQLTAKGHGIGAVATLPTVQLEALALESTTAPGHRLSARFPHLRPQVADYFDRALQALLKLDAEGFETVLNEAVVVLGQQGLLQHFIAPLVQAIGELWREGTIKASHEHFASALIRSFLTRTAKPYAPNGAAPQLLVATPVGQLHELGAVLVAAAASAVGWRVTYLGTSLPAAEIAGAANADLVRAVALSIVYPEDDPALPAELELLRKYLPEKIALLAGGRAARAYQPTLEKIGAILCGDLDHLCGVLDGLRQPRA